MSNPLGRRLGGELGALALTERLYRQLLATFELRKKHAGPAGKAVIEREESFIEARLAALLAERDHPERP